MSQERITVNREVSASTLAVARHSVGGGAAVLAVLVLLFMSQALFPPPGQALGGHDIRGLFHPWLTLAREAIRQGNLPLWDRWQFGGYPFLSNPQVALFYPPTWLAIVLPVGTGMSWYVALHLWLAGLGMFLFVRAMGAGQVEAWLAGLTFCFSGFMAARIAAGHVGLLAVHVWIPWLLLASQWSIRRGDVRSGLIAGLPLGLAILAGHTTSLLYLGLIWLAFLVYTGISTGRWSLVGRQAILSILTGSALGAVSLIPMAELSLLSSRAAGLPESYGQWSFPPAHLITLIIPRYFGDPIVGYWSVDNFEELAAYAGLLPLLGITLALHRPSRLGWLYLSLMLFGLLLALGSYGFLYPILYKLLPPFRLARAPGRAMALFVFAASGLLAEALTSWKQIGVDGNRPLKWLERVLMVGGLVGVAGLAATGATFAAQHPSDTSGRLWLQLGGWGWALIVFLAGGLLLRGYLSDRLNRAPAEDLGHQLPSMRRSVWGLGLAALTLIDLWAFGFNLIRLQPLGPDPLWADARRLISPSDERVLPWGLAAFQLHNDAGLVGLESVFGYNTLQVQAGKALMESVPDPRSTAYDILSAGYVITGGELDSRYLEGERGLVLLTHTERVWVYRRARVMPLARLVYRAEIIPEREAAIARLHEPDFDPATTAILEAQPGCELGPVSAGATRVVQRRTGHWTIETQSDTPGLLVVSETAYPGWKVRIDGKPGVALTAYTAVRAVCVPAGTHHVEWIFDPLSVKIGGAISAVALIGIGWAAITARRGRREEA